MEAIPSNQGYNGSGTANCVGTVGFPYPLLGKKLAIAPQTSDREMRVLTGPNPN
jgi:hypothetical protein